MTRFARCQVGGRVIYFGKGKALDLRRDLVSRSIRPSTAAALATSMDPTDKNGRHPSPLRRQVPSQDPRLEGFGEGRAEARVVGQ
jgi:hypothetical protein